MGVDAVVDKLVAKINGEPKSALAVLKPTTSNNALREFTKRFHDERLAQVEAGDAPVELGGGARVIVHIVPLGAVSEFLNLSAQQMAEGHRVWPLDSGVHGHFTSQWGLVNYGTQLDRINEQTYAVVGSDGTIEAVDLDLLADKRGRTMVLNNFYIEDKLVEFIFNAEQFYKQVKVDPPFGVCISLTRVRGYEGHRVALDGSHPLKSDDIHLPSAIIPAFSEAQPEVGDHLKRQFDKLANAAGWNASQSYASDGTWHSRLGL
jgi:hypothetical protein